MRGRAPLARIAALVALIAAAVLIAVMLLRGSGYDVKARFQNASQLVKGNLVQVSGLPAGEVEDIRLTDDGQAELTLSIDDRYARCAAARRRRSARRRCPASPTATSTCGSATAGRPRSPTAACSSRSRPRPRSTSTRFSTRSTSPPARTSRRSSRARTPST